jgi:hypothetical protein
MTKRRSHGRLALGSDVRTGRRRVAGACASGAAALLLVACGAEGEAAGPPGSTQNPLRAQPTAQGRAADPTPATSGSRAGAHVARRRRAAAQAREPAPASGSDEPGYEALVDRQSRRPEQRATPCTLVTRAEASRIVGTSLPEPIEAPLGPTCIYRTTAGKILVTVAVESIELRAIRRQLRQARRVAISGRTGYCGTHGQTGLYVRLAASRVLSVTASCDVARSFALKAVKRASS